MLIIAVAAVACGRPPSRSSTSAGGATPSPKPTPSATTAPRPEPVDPRNGGLDVGFGEFAITLEAKAIRPGRVTLVVHNGGKLVHGFEMKEDGERGGGDDRFKIEAATFGPDDTIRIVANLPAGQYEIECYVANHESLGMRTTLDVRADAPLVRPRTAPTGTVDIRGFSFEPGTVSVQAGSKVTWRNQDPTAHTVTSTDGSFSSEPLASGKGYVFAFVRAGTFAYACAIHPSMQGTVKVTA